MKIKKEDLKLILCAVALIALFLLASSLDYEIAMSHGQ